MGEGNFRGEPTVTQMMNQLVVLRMNTLATRSEVDCDSNDNESEFGCYQLHLQ